MVGKESHTRDGNGPISAQFLFSIVFSSFQKIYPTFLNEFYFPVFSKFTPWDSVPEDDTLALVFQLLLGCVPHPDSPFRITLLTVP